MSLIDDLFERLEFFDDEEGGLYLQRSDDSDDAYAVAYYGTIKEVQRDLIDKGWQQRDISDIVRDAERRSAKRIGYFSSIEVQSARGLGLGWRMAARMLEELQARGCTVVYLHADRRALTFWERQGFSYLTSRLVVLPVMFKQLNKES